MASVAEMLALAEHQGNIDNPAPKIIEGAFGGYLAGRETARKSGATALQNMLKIMEITDKVQKIKIEQRQQDMNENMMKSFGLLPMGDSEHKAALSTMWEMAGDGKNPQYVNTPQSKLAKMANNLEWRPGWSMKGGFSVKAYPKKTIAGTATAANSELNAQKADLVWAEKMAREENWKKLTAGLKPWQIAQMKIQPNTVNVPPDLLHKYLPVARALRTNDMASYDKLMAGIKSGQPAALTPSALNLGNVMMMQQDLLNQRAMLTPTEAADDDAAETEYEMDEDEE